MRASAARFKSGINALSLCLRGAVITRRCARWKFCVKTQAHRRAGIVLLLTANDGVLLPPRVIISGGIARDVAVNSACAHPRNEKEKRRRGTPRLATSALRPGPSGRLPLSRRYRHYHRRRRQARNPRPASIECVWTCPDHGPASRLRRYRRRRGQTG